MGAEQSPTDSLNFPDMLPEPLKSEAASRDPSDWYDKMRADGPVHYDSRRDVYDVFSYEHVKAGLQDGERLARKTLSDTPDDKQDPFAYIGTAMMWSDGTDHVQAKSQLFEYFQPSRMQKLRDSIEAVTESQLDIALEGGSEFDFIKDFATPVPLRVIMDFVGVPRDDQQQVLEWLDTLRNVAYSESSSVGTKDGSKLADPAKYFRDLVAQRRREPRDDIISQLLEETELSEAEIGSNCFDFIAAGQGTMSDLFANALYLFETHDLYDELDQYGLEVVLEEVLRCRAPLQARARVTTEPVTLHETQIPADETVILWIGAANRDPEVYDRSNTFIPDRNPDHLAYGSGPHMCIGAPLARLEGPVVFRTFFDRIVDFDVRIDESRPKTAASRLGFQRLPVTVDTV